MATPFKAPSDFTARFPRYNYRDSKGRISVQWREAALDMANDRERLEDALQSAEARNARLREALEDVLRDQLKAVNLHQMAPGPRARIEKARAALAEGDA